jgi:hypothetical protein
VERGWPPSKVFGNEEHMNRLIVFIALIIFQGASLTWGASYLLHLKNGNELRTSHYWEEGDEIRFYVYGGVAGIQKGFVSRVTTSNVNYKEDRSDKEDLEKSQTPIVLSGPRSKGSPQIQIGKKESQSGGNAEKGEVVDFDYYRERRAALKEKLEDAILRNREATARKDQEAKELTRKEYLGFSKQIIDLGDELKRKNKGVLPDWWQE